jgi:membrane-associated phospholipid phosphatase
LVGIALADAFIACWDEKYRSQRIRPETAIQKLINPRWAPLLQTPPFPEYVSGHSVVSSTAALVLTQYFGENQSFVDDTETAFGLPIRKFQSFQQAAREASLSRLYGGIHFRDAIEQGIWLGEQVGKKVISKLQAHF